MMDVKKEETKKDYKKNKRYINPEFEAPLMLNVSPYSLTFKETDHTTITTPIGTTTKTATYVYAYFELHNNYSGARTQAFKIKSSDLGVYSSKPAFGIIKKGESVNIKVTYNKTDTKPNERLHVIVTSRIIESIPQTAEKKEEEVRELFDTVYNASTYVQGTYHFYCNHVDALDEEEEEPAELAD